MVERLDCPRPHSVATRKSRGNETSYWYGACDLFWDVNVELACDKEEKTCSVVERQRHRRRSGRPLL